MKFLKIKLGFDKNVSNPISTTKICQNKKPTYTCYFDNKNSIIRLVEEG